MPCTTDTTAMRNITPMNTPMIEKVLLSFCARMVCRARRMASKKGIYSYRSASTGSSRAAFLAGRMPNNRPVKAAKPRARTTEPMGTYDGTGVALRSEERRVGKEGRDKGEQESKGDNTE